MAPRSPNHKHRDPSAGNGPGPSPAHPPGPGRRRAHAPLRPRFLFESDQWQRAAPRGPLGVRRCRGAGLDGKCSSGKAGPPVPVCLRAAAAPRWVGAPGAAVLRPRPHGAASAQRDLGCRGKAPWPRRACPYLPTAPGLGLCPARQKDECGEREEASDLLDALYQIRDQPNWETPGLRSGCAGALPWVPVLTNDSCGRHLAGYLCLRASPDRNCC